MKMNGIQVSFLGLLLWYAVLMVSSSSYGTNKPGKCPTARRYNPEGFLSPLTSCQNDGGCDGVKKCCADHDSRVCKMPAAVRPGTCPRPSKIPYHSKDDFCTSDSECAPGAKCCRTNGGNTCWPSVGEKAGECPGPEIMCFAPGRPFCDSDTSCTLREKCCHKNTCNAQCTTIH